MPCQVSVQSVVANSWPLVQGSGVFCPSSPDSKVEQRHKARMKNARAVLRTKPPGRWRCNENRKQKCIVHTFTLSRSTRFNAILGHRRECDGCAQPPVLTVA